ncbi:MAG: hypothetical protein ACM3SR_13635 [Ignavibacteriales bacterium]
MKKYQVLLSRTHIVDIQAENKKEACRNVEWYLGDCKDLSSEDDRKRDNFLIERIEPAINEAFEVAEVNADDE